MTRYRLLPVGIQMMRMPAMRSFAGGDFEPNGHEQKEILDPGRHPSTGRESGDLALQSIAAGAIAGRLQVTVAQLSHY